MCHIVKYARMALQHEDKDTGVLFGFTNNIIKLAKLFNTSKFIFTWDSRKSYRRQIFPEYKLKRTTVEKTEEEREYDRVCYAQSQEIRTRLLPRLGFKNNFITTGLEADDVMASIARGNGALNMVIVTDDRDLLQCIRTNCPVYHPRSAKLYTYEDFKKDYGLEPYQYAKILEIAGCTSDEVPSVAPKVGKVTATKYIRGSLPKTWKVYLKITSPEAKQIRRRNRALVKLPFPGYNGIQPCPEFDLDKDEQLYIRDFTSTFQHYGFQSFLKHEKFAEWKRHLRLKLGSDHG
jgi:DNA polymerase-1